MKRGVTYTLLLAIFILVISNLYLVSATAGQNEDEADCVRGYDYVMQAYCPDGSYCSSGNCKAEECISGYSSYDCNYNGLCLGVGCYWNEAEQGCRYNRKLDCTFPSLKEDGVPMKIAKTDDYEIIVDRTCTDECSWEIEPWTCSNLINKKPHETEDSKSPSHEWASPVAQCVRYRDSPSDLYPYVEYTTYSCLDKSGDKLVSESTTVESPLAGACTDVSAFTNSRQKCIEACNGVDSLSYGMIFSGPAFTIELKKLIDTKLQNKKAFILTDTRGIRTLFDYCVCLSKKEKVYYTEKSTVLSTMGSIALFPIKIIEYASAKITGSSTDPFFLPREENCFELEGDAYQFPVLDTNKPFYVFFKKQQKCNDLSEESEGNYTLFYYTDSEINELINSGLNSTILGSETISVGSEESAFSINNGELLIYFGAGTFDSEQDITIRTVKLGFSGEKYYPEMSFEDFKGYYSLFVNGQIDKSDFLGVSKSWVKSS
ncbi:hypothetical protein COV15_00130 [Candidatus Woesearchaeota archaeon CG10_big_fil_rev_8_21_14_0_10_34_12]|nr:MAG: hypothetical protein COV15_00130 [Candidatus Woesearchaeota archaeon CG10_big_fil_rev_8_21_14_0_10_34_12]